MPNYDFKCTGCDVISEIIVSSFTSTPECPKCGHPEMDKLFSPPRPRELLPISGPSTGELWKAFKDHSIRFVQDSKGNECTKITNTGEIIPSGSFTSSSFFISSIKLKYIINYFTTFSYFLFNLFIFI